MVENQCAVCGVIDRLDAAVNQRLLDQARTIWPDGRDLDYVCSECDAVLPPPSPQTFRPAPWSTPKAGDGKESGATERQQAGWPTLAREAQRVLTSWS